MSNVIDFPRSFVPVSVTVVHVEVLLVVVLVGSMDGIELGTEGISVSVHFTGHVGERRLQEVLEFVSDVTNGSFCLNKQKQCIQ